MKKITYFNVLVFTVLLLTMGGCNEDKFLKEDPRDALYPENLLVDYNGFKSMITPLYGLMRAEYRRADAMGGSIALCLHCLLYSSARPRDRSLSRRPSSA